MVAIISNMRKLRHIQCVTQDMKKNYYQFANKILIEYYSFDSLYQSDLKQNYLNPKLKASFKFNLFNNIQHHLLQNIQVKYTHSSQRLRLISSRFKIFNSFRINTG